MSNGPTPERPDFEPPEGPAYGSFPDPAPHHPAGSGGAEPIPPEGGTPTEPPAYWPPPPPPPPPAPQVVPPPPQVILPPGPYKKPWPPPPRPPRERGGGKGSIVLGMAITLGTLVISAFLSTGTGPDAPLYELATGAIVLAPVLLIVVGIVLAVIPRTIRTGAGILLGLGAAVLIAGGLCIALLASYGS